MYASSIADKIRKAEALANGAKTEGERLAALEGLARLRASCKAAEERSTGPANGKYQRKETSSEHGEPEEALPTWRFRIDNPWSRELLVSELKRAGIRPFRQKGQHRSTVCARMPRDYFENVFNPRFEQLDRWLRGSLDRVTKSIIESSNQ